MALHNIVISKSEYENITFGNKTIEILEVDRDKIIAPDDIVIFINEADYNRTIMVNVISVLQSGSVGELVKIVSDSELSYVKDELNTKTVSLKENGIMAIRFELITNRKLDSVDVSFEVVERYIMKCVENESWGGKWKGHYRKWCSDYSKRFESIIKSKCGLDSVLEFFDDSIEDYYYKSSLDLKEEVEEAGYDVEVEGFKALYDYCYCKYDRRLELTELIPIYFWWVNTRNDIIVYFCGFDVKNEMRRFASAFDGFGKTE